LHPGAPITSTHQIHCNERAVPISPNNQNSLRVRERLPPQQSVNRAESQFSTGLECFRAGLRAQDRAHLTPEVCAVTSQRWGLADLL